MLYTKHEDEVSLVFWRDWLYKPLLYRHDLFLAFGIAELGCGGGSQRIQKTEQTVLYILSGEGTVTFGGARQPFRTGAQFVVPSQVEHHLDCESPTRLLIASGPHSPQLRFMAQDLKPTQTVAGQGQCQFVTSGRIKLTLQDTSQWLTAGTAFYVEPNIGYTLQNVGNTKALILIVSGKAEPAVYEQYQVRN